MGFTCDSCRKAFSGAPVKSVTGRSLCHGCSDHLLGAAAGIIAGESSGAGLPGTVAQGAATGGVFAWIRRWRHRDPASS